MYLPPLSVYISAGRSLDFELPNFVLVNCQRTSIIRDHEIKVRNGIERPEDIVKVQITTNKHNILHFSPF